MYEHIYIVRNMRNGSTLQRGRGEREVGESGGMEGKEGGREREREGGRERGNGGREGGRERGMEGGRERGGWSCNRPLMMPNI